MKLEQSGTVVAIQAGVGLVNRLGAMGIRPGTKIVKISGNVMSGPVTVRTGNIQLALGHGMASKIIVEVEDMDEGLNDA